MNPITIPNITIPVIGLPTIGIPSVGFPSASGGGLIWPAGMKEHIKAIYDPKKQGLTNYDVIEAYTEDFKKWNNCPEKYTGSLTSNSLALTNVSQKTALIYSPIKPYDFKVLIRGLQEGQHVKFGFDYGEVILEADKDGVYTLEWKEGLKSYGIYTNFVGECNITITQLPTSILKDLSGNGNHAYLYGGKGKLNSGMGVYKQDYTTYKNDGNTNVEDVKPDTFVLLAGNLSRLGMPYKDIVGENIPAYKINVTGITDGTVTYFYRNEDGKQLQYVIKSDGEYELPTCYREGTEGTAVNIVANNNSNKITITQIPDYPDQLCYDGKMYAVCYGFPILTDYTVMADRTWFDKMNRACFLSKITTSGTGAFGFEFYNEFNACVTYSYNLFTDVELFKNGITYQTKNSYNGTPIKYNASGIKDNSELYIGKLRPTEHSGYVGCHGKIIIADRSFTEDEITWLKDNWKKI
ncbi:hypothetical protein ACJEEN_12245 [Bacteroides clarus]|uniref:hypothetical protein n=1 Tax=Bacteroides clarus TaxID=626929 RepID=UPI0039782FE5